MAEFDIVIHGGRLIDGTGNPWFYGDLAIKDGKIDAQGHRRSRSSMAVPLPQDISGLPPNTGSQYI